MYKYYANCKILKNVSYRLVICVRAYCQYLLIYWQLNRLLCDFLL
jgi:hypothetical protein